MIQKASLLSLPIALPAAGSRSLSVSGKNPQVS